MLFVLLLSIRISLILSKIYSGYTHIVHCDFKREEDRMSLASLGFSELPLLLVLFVF